MERIGIVGISARAVDAATLGRFTIAKAEREERLAALAETLGVDELLYLATCNRVEVAYRVPGDQCDLDFRRPVFRALTGVEALPGEAERTLRGWIGEGAVEHLFLVAAGFDSAQVGEREIQGQLREALATARTAGTSGVLLDRLVEEALRVAHQVHRQTRIGAGRTSLAEIAADHLLERVRRTPSAVALIGVSPMTRRAGETLLREGVPVIVVNRTLAHAEEMACEIGAAEAIALDEFRARPPQVEALLSATGSPEAVLDRSTLERLAARTPSHEPPLVVDLAVPADVEPAVCRAAGVVRIGMDEINAAAERQRSARLAETAAARELVDQALAGLRCRLAERMLAPVVASLNRRYRETALEGVERLVAKNGLTLDPAGRKALDRWAETLARRFAHLPTLGLRGLAAEQGMLAVRSFLAAADRDLFGELTRGADEIDALLAPSERGLGA